MSLAQLRTNTRNAVPGIPFSPKDPKGPERRTMNYMLNNPNASLCCFKVRTDVTDEQVVDSGINSHNPLRRNLMKHWAAKKEAGWTEVEESDWCLPVEITPIYRGRNNGAFTRVLLAVQIPV